VGKLHEAITLLQTGKDLVRLGVLCWILAAMCLGLMLACLLWGQFLRATLLFVFSAFMAVCGIAAFVIALVPTLLANLP
jgi:hypothetical protein